MIDQLPEEIKKDIKLHSLDESPYECCGIISLLDNEYKLTKCKNAAEDKKKKFKISPKDYLRAKGAGKIIAYYHSHTDENEDEFSEMDKKNSQGHGLPLLMYNTKEDKLFEYVP